MWSPADVLDHVGDSQPRLAETCLDRAPEQQLLAEDAAWQRLALGPEHALVAVPALAVAGQARGRFETRGRGAEALGLLRRIVVLLRGVFGHEQRVVDAARGEEPPPQLRKKPSSSDS